MITYIKSDVRKIYIELENELNSSLYPNLGTTWEDYLNNFFVKLSNEQVAFKNEHPGAKVHEVWNMELDPVHVRNLDDAKNEKKLELARYKEQHVGDFKYNGTKIWFNIDERLAKKNEVETAKNNGASTYKLQDDIELNVNKAISLLDSMSNREFVCNQAVAVKANEIDTLEDIEAVDAVDVSDEFPAEIEINDRSLDEQEKTSVSNNEALQVIALMRNKINSIEMTDEEAYKVKLLYPQWESFIGGSLSTGMKVQYNDKLFKVIQQVPVVLENQYPSEDTAALYTEINETNAGTFEDPIPYNGNMILEEGKYYVQGGITYKCIRNSGIAVYDTLAHLATVEGGSYVKVATE